MRHSSVLTAVKLCLVLPRVEEVPNTSTVALRVVGGDEKGTQCLEVYPGGI
jgi:hypothetical protein